ncbi:MAG: LysR family transcriptional regulator [bacterium]
MSMPIRMRKVPALKDLKALQYFVRVAELGSFSRAAEALRLTQPAVSRKVRRLEAELGVELLYRKGHQLAVTEAGDILLSRSRDLARQAEKAWDDARAGAATPSGSLAVGTANIIGQLLLPDVLSEYRSQFPDVRVHVSEGYSGFLEEWLLDRRIDVGLFWGRPSSGEINVRPLMSVEMCLIAPPRPLKQWEGSAGLGDACTLRQVVQAPLILPALPHALRLLAETSAAKYGARLNVAMEVDGLALANELVRAGLGYTLMTHPGAQEDHHLNKVRSIPIRSPSVNWVLSFAMRRDTRPSQAIRAFHRAVHQACSRKIQVGELRGRLSPIGALA